MPPHEPSAFLLSCTPIQPLCPDDAVEERPRQDVPGQTAEDAADPEVEGAAEVSGGAQGRQAGGGRRGGDAQDVEEGGDEGGEAKVEEEAGVRLKTEDAGGDAEEGGGDVLEVGESLLRRHWSAVCAFGG
jgi:hypothetical protein